MTKAARGLRSLVPSIDLLISSPLRRAVETGRIIADVYGGIQCIERGELAPGSSPHRLIERLAHQPTNGTTCIVGHEPDLSELLAVLLTGESERPPKLKKGSVSLVMFAGPPAASSGSL